MIPRFLLLSIVCFSLAPVGLGQTTAPAPRTITVRGTGIVSARPDRVRISMQVMTRSESASDAMRQASQRTSDVIVLLQSNGVAERDIQTQRITVAPEYDREKRTSPPTIVGYQAQNELTAFFRKDAMDNLGTFLDRAVAAGATNFSGMSYETSAQPEFEQLALEQAASDARTRAERLAARLGAGLGAVLSVSEAGLASPGPRADVMMMGEASSPVMTGEMQITAKVDVVFELVTK